MADPIGLPPSPWVRTFADNYGNSIRITLPFNTTTGALADATVYRDATCQWTRIYVGVGADGTPNSTNKVFTVPSGTTTVTAAQLAQRGLNTITDVIVLQITAGP